MKPLNLSEQCRAKEVMEEEIVSQCLRSRPFLRTLEEKKPVFETSSPKSQYARKAWVNRWFADEHGIVIHYPEAIYVTGPDFESFRTIPLGKDNLKYKFRPKDCNSINLFVTKKLVALEIRMDRCKGKAEVYDRKSLELIFTTRYFTGHFYTEGPGDEKELFVKEDNVVNGETRIHHIDEIGNKKFLWKGFSYCECRGRADIAIAFHHKRKLLRHCWQCHKGMMEDMDTEKCTKDYQLSRKRYLQKIAVNWIDSANILAVEERLAFNEKLRSLSLVNIETWKIELDFKSRLGDFHRCYAVSPEYLVVCYRNGPYRRPKENMITNMIVKNRQSGDLKQFQVPEFLENITSLKLMSGSILVAMPGGFTKPETGIYCERVYTMDLSEEDPRSSIISFRVPASEVRTIGNNKIICKISSDSEDHFKVYNLV